MYRLLGLCVSVGVGACGFSGTLPGDASDAGDAGDDGPTADAAEVGAVTWTEQLATEFADGTLSGAVVTPHNTVEPNAYAAGLVFVAQRRSPPPIIANVDIMALPATFDASALMTDGHQWRDAVDSRRWISGSRAGNASDFLAWAIGEIYLPVEATSLRLEADDSAKIWIGGVLDTPRSTFNDSTFPITVSSAGWYPIRVAWRDGFGNNRLSLSLLSANGDIPLTGKLRTDRSQTPGLLADGFINGGGTGPGGNLYDAVGLLDRTLASTDLLAQQLEIVDADGAYAARWAGQLLVPTAGDYTFAINADFGARLTIDGVPAYDTLADDAPRDRNMSELQTVELTPGWHDIAASMHGQTAAAPDLLRVTVDAGPTYSGGIVPAMAVRPVISGHNHFVRATNLFEDAYAGVGIPLSIKASANATGLLVDVYLAFDGATPFTARLMAPGGALVGMFSDTQAKEFPRATLPIPAGTAIAGDWRLEITDGDSTSEDLLVAAITVYQTEASPAPATFSPIANNASYVSNIHDFGKQVTLTKLTWQAWQASSGFRVGYRLCPNATTCDGSFVAATHDMPLSGSAPTIGQFVQYRVDFGSDGRNAPALRSLTVHARE